MELFTLLVLVGLAAVGAGTIAYITAGLIFIAGAIVLGAIAFVMIMCGVVGDYLYNRRMDRYKLPYRLPFYYRWKGWRIGSLNEDAHRHGWKSGMYYDRRTKKIVGIFRPVHKKVNLPT